MFKGMRYTSRRMELCTAAVLGIFALGVATYALAQGQDPAAPARNRAGAAAAPQQQQRQTIAPGDHLLAAWLIVDNDGEVELAELAEKNAKDKDVKAFAKQMAEEHGKLVKQLERFGGPSNRRDRGAQGQQPNARTQTRGTAPATATAPAAGGQPRTTARPVHPAGQIDPVALKQQLGDKCLQTARRELEKKSGAEFDRCYMEMQVFMHLHVIDEMEVFATHASPELQKIIEEGQKSAEDHLKHARELVKQVSDSGSKK